MTFWLNPLGFFLSLFSHNYLTLVVGCCTNYTSKAQISYLFILLLRRYPLNSLNPTIDCTSWSPLSNLTNSTTSIGLLFLLSLSLSYTNKLWQKVYFFIWAFGSYFFLFYHVKVTNLHDQRKCFKDCWFHDDMLAPCGHPYTINTQSITHNLSLSLSCFHMQPNKKLIHVYKFVLYMSYVWLL